MVAPQEEFYKEIPGEFFNNELRVDPKVMERLFNRDPANIIKVESKISISCMSILR